MTLVIILCIVAIVVLSPLIVTAIVCFPYFCMVIKRAVMLHHLKRQAKERGYAYKPLRRAVFMSLNTSHGYDLLLVGKEKILAVKLWSAINAQSAALVLPDRTVLERTVVPEPLQTGDKQRKTVRQKKRRFPSLDGELQIKTKKPVLRLVLYYPKHSAAYVKVRGEAVKLRMGARLFGASICDDRTITRFM